MTTPQYHVGSVLENQLGLQVGRILGKYCVRSFRPSATPRDLRAYIEVLGRDGVLIIPEFLPPAAFTGVLGEVRQLRETLEFRRFRERDGRLSVARTMLRRDQTSLPNIASYLSDNPTIRQIAGTVSKVKPASAPIMELTIYKMIDASAPDNDEENLLHADLHTPTIKCFYFLNAADETNGAFIYAKGSHKMTLARLRYEYDMSVRTARLKRGYRLTDGVEVRAGTERAVMTAEQRDQLGITESQFPVKPNTLVIANNVGFHRRGQFTSGLERASIVLNFRHYQSPFWS